MNNNQSQNSNEYDLKIDAQVEKFVEIKQKLTYFLIAGSIAVIVFLANFVIKNRADAENLIWLIILSSLAGLFTSGFSLVNIYLELKSYKLHIKYRYQKMNWDSLTDKEQKNWDRINILAARLLNGAFISLFIEIAFAVIFFILFFILNETITPEK